MHIIITVDTEADDQWRKDAPPTIENVFALDRFQNLCERYGMPATYLLTFEVASDVCAAEQFRAWREKGAEIGAHLHPWTTPPITKGEGATRTFPSQLDDAALRAKFETLTDKVSEITGEHPTSYRAGRWGFDTRQSELLKEHNYLIDLSITPGISWKKGEEPDESGPDFTHESVAPHMLNDAVLEVPMTILYAGLLHRLRWLRIFENTTPGNLRSVLRAARRLDLPVVVFMIHSSELVAGKSPYVKTPEALECVYRNIEALFNTCMKENISGITASDFALFFRASGVEPKPFVTL